MAKELNTSIEIDAPARIVWEALTDFSRYSEWNPFFLSIRGEAKQGGQLDAYIEPPGGKGMTVRLIIVDLKPERELCWTNQVLLPGILDSEHHFQIEPLGDHRTRFINREIHSGLLEPLLRRWYLDTKIRQKLEEMNRALKQRIEE